jgi:HSP20 family protein
MALLIKPEPFSSEFNRLFDTFFQTANASPQRWVPAMDLFEADDHFVLKADLPGLAEDDVTIEVQDGTLTVSGERRSETEKREKGWYRVERSFGRFSRSLTLPEGVDADKIDASFDKGVLEIHIPKPEERKPRRIAIGATNGDKTLEGTATEK